MPEALFAPTAKGAAALKSGATALKSMAMGPDLPWGQDNDLAEEYAHDARAFLLERCAAAVANMTLTRSLVMCATYYLPAFETLPNGQRWYRAETSQDEALWQGKVGLLIAMGPMAFVDTGNIQFGGFKPQIGDWLQWDIHDARQCTLNRVHCRWMQDTQIIARVIDPKLVY